VVTDAAYRPRNPEESLLYQVVAGELETFLAAQRDHERQVPGFTEKESRSFSIAACSPVASSGSLATPAGWTASFLTYPSANGYCLRRTYSVTGNESTLPTIPSAST